MSDFGEHFLLITTQTQDLLLLSKLETKEIVVSSAQVVLMGYQGLWCFFSLYYFGAVCVLAGTLSHYEASRGMS